MHPYAIKKQGKALCISRVSQYSTRLATPIYSYLYHISDIIYLLYKSPCVSLRVVLSNLKVLWLIPGDTGVAGLSAQSPVVEELRKKRELATI